MNYTIEELSNKYNELKNTVEENTKKIEGINIDIEEFENVIELINIHGDINNQIRQCDEQINELKSFGNLKEKEILELQEKREFMSSIREYLNSFNALESKEQQLETLNKELDKLKNQVKELEQINAKKEKIMSNLKEVCKEKQEEIEKENNEYNIEAENTRQNNISVIKNCRPLTIEMRKVEERLKELEELEILTKSQNEEKESLKQKQIEITKEFKKIIPNPKDVLTSEEMFNSYVVNKKQYKENTSKKDLEKINNLINEIENFTKKEEIIKEQPIVKTEEPIKNEEPKEERTLARIISEYQDVKKQLEDLAKNNSTDLTKMIDLLQKQNQLELEIKAKTTEFNEKVEQKQEETQKRTEEIIKEQAPIELTEKEKIEQNNRKVFDDIISRRNLNNDDKYDLNSSNKENTNSFINDVQKLYEQKQEEDYQNAKKMLGNDSSMTLEDLRKKLSLEIDPATVNKIIDRFEQDQKIDNPLTEEEIKQFDDIVNSKESNNKKIEESKSVLTEEEIKQFDEIVNGENNNEIDDKFNDEEMEYINKTLGDNTVVDIKPEKRVYQKRVQEHEEELNKIFGNTSEQEQILYVPKEEKIVLPENQQKTVMSKYERQMAKEMGKYFKQLEKQEIEKKVKRKTTKEKYLGLRTKIGTKITNLMNSVDQFLSRGPENVDELEERIGRSR